MANDANLAEIEEYKKKLAQNPDALIFVPLADAYRKAGMYDDALEVCKKGIEKHPSYSLARVVMGRVFFEKDMTDEAIEEFKKVEAVDMDNIMVHTLLGNVYMKKKMFAQAIEQFQRVLSLNPEDNETQEKLQEALSARQEAPAAPAPAPKPAAPPPVEEKKEEAKPAVPEAKKEEAKPAVDPKKEEAQKSIKAAELYTKKEEFDKAIEIYRELLDQDPENFIIQQRLREVYNLQDKKLQKERKTTAAAPKAEEDEMDKITAEDILDVMKEAVEEDKVEEEEKKQAIIHRKEEENKISIPAAKKEEVKAAAIPEAKKETPKPAAPEVKPMVIPEAKKEEPKPAMPEAKKEEPKPAPAPEVKKEEPKPAAVPAPAASADLTLTPDKVSQVNVILKSMLEVDGMVGSIFFSKGGNMLAHALPSNVNAAETGKLIASIIEKTDKSVKNMKQGKLNQVIISSENGPLIFTEIASGVLFLVGNQKINVGKMGLVVKEVVGKLKKAING